MYFIQGTNLHTPPPLAEHSFREILCSQIAILETYHFNNLNIYFFQCSSPMPNTSKLFGLNIECSTPILLFVRSKTYFAVMYSVLNS